MCRLAVFLFTACVCLMLISLCAAYNDDQPIYKWSPLWFNRYFRNMREYKRGGGVENCVMENRRCSYWGIEKACCGAAQCILDHCVSIETIEHINSLD